MATEEARIVREKLAQFSCLAHGVDETPHLISHLMCSPADPRREVFVEEANFFVNENICWGRLGPT